MAYSFDLTQLSNIANDQIISTESLKAITDEAIRLLGQSTGENVLDSFQFLQKAINKYLEQFSLYYRNFLIKNSIYKKVQSYTLQTNHGPQNKSVPLNIRKKDYSQNKKATQEFINILFIGRNLLNQIREVITRQTIETMITIQTSNGLYRIPESVLQGKNAINITLSTYGASKNSIFSLAYSIDKQIITNDQSLKKYLIQQGEESQGDSIYEQIWQTKELYLEQKTMLTGRKYKPVFNSKDAEIYNLMQAQNLIHSKWLTVKRYAQLRASMGGGGGYRTSSMKLGDVGLIQDKMIGKGTNQVNFASFGIIYNNLVELKTLISSVGNNKQALIQGLIHQFTEKRSLINDAVSYQANEEARKNIKNLFK